MDFGMIQLAYFLIGVAVLTVTIALAAHYRALAQIPSVLLAATALISIVVTVALWFNHMRMPLNLEAMESTVLQHVERAAALEPIYTEPAPTFVALAYNPLYYVLATPFVWLFGTDLPTLRFVAILGAIGSGLMIYSIVQRHTRSRWWGLMAAGLFAAAYGAMDYYLDTAHSDSWFLFTALAGSLLIERSHARAGRITGLILLVLAFWFKQHGALFAVGGLAWLAWQGGRTRMRDTVLYASLVGLLGPVAYVLAGPLLFGPQFLYFTWTVPRAWSEIYLATFTRYIRYLLGYFLVLVPAAGLVTLWYALKDRGKLTIYHVQFVFAVLSGLMGSLDPGSQNNVYIAAGVFSIIVGLFALVDASHQFGVMRRYHLRFFALLLSFSLLLYDPAAAYVSLPAAQASYADLITVLEDLDGPVFTPDLGQLPRDYSAYPAAHFVALDDMIRGPGRDENNHPLMREVLQDVVEPEEPPAYILKNWGLGLHPTLAFLLDYYVLEIDYGDRFAALDTLPSLYSFGYPRYLYRYDPEAAQAHDTSRSVTDMG